MTELRYSQDLATNDTMAAISGEPRTRSRAPGRGRRKASVHRGGTPSATGLPPRRLLTVWKTVRTIGASEAGAPKICRVIFGKMQGGRPISLAESHCAAEGWKEFSLSKEQGEATGIAGKNGGTAGCKGGRVQGSTERTVTEDRRLPRSLGARETGLRQKLQRAGRKRWGRIPLGPLSPADGMAAGISEAPLPGDHTSAPQGQNDR
jgi:hypothetical protein